MKRAALCACLTLAALALSLPAEAQLYKWVDAHGRTQYSDRPPVGRPVQRMDRPTPGAPTDDAPAAGASPGGATPTTAEQEQAFRKRRMEQEEAAQKQAKADAEKQAKDAQCQRTRNYLKSLEGGRRVVRTNDKGEDEYLDDVQRRSEIERTREDLSTHCD